MTFHHWSDKDFDWRGLDEAIDYIDKYITRWGLGTIRVLQAKEKFGLARIYVSVNSNMFTMWYARLVYKYAYRKAVRKFPTLRDEILEDADYSEWLKGV
jgi:hypothetical protein